MTSRRAALDTAGTEALNPHLGLLLGTAGDD
jgi:hypothetical protein